MAFFCVNPEKETQLLDRMARLGIQENDLDERFIRGGGKGGQKVNKTSSCVYLLHKPTGIEVKCQRERSQSMNRFFARRELCDRLEERIRGIKSQKQQERERIRRQKRRRSRRQKERILADKRHHAEKKAMRRNTGTD